MYTMSQLGGQISKRERERERERESIKSGNQELCFAALLTCVYMNYLYSTIALGVIPSMS